MSSSVSRSAVFVGFDGSEDSRRALLWAADECELRQAPLVVLHADRWSSAALALPTFEEEAQTEEAILEEGIRLATKEHPTVAVEGRRLPPPAGESLVEAAQDGSLLVVGSRGLGHVQQFLLGSVSRYCTEHAHCPVLIVHAPRARAQ